MELNICLIGCGMIGKEHIERIQNRIRGAKVVAVCDVFEEGVKKGAELAGPGTKTYTDFNEAINDPDVNAVVVTTPGQFHKGNVICVSSQTVSVLYIRDFKREDFRNAENAPERV